MKYFFVSPLSFFLSFRKTMHAALGRDETNLREREKCRTAKWGESRNGLRERRNIWRTYPFEETATSDGRCLRRRNIVQNVLPLSFFPSFFLFFSFFPLFFLSPLNDLCRSLQNSRRIKMRWIENLLKRKRKEVKKERTTKVNRIMPIVRSRGVNHEA